MAGNLIREVRRATLTHLAANEGLTALVPATSIYPSTVPANPAWPFIRFDAPNSLPLDGACYAGAEVTFLLHCFAKPRYSGSAMIETAEDYAARILSAMHLAVHNHRVIVSGTSAQLRAVSSRLLIDGAEADAYHGILNMRARVLAA
ncbi:DUF3168 domain-containing protein [Sphingomonas baiyangensis]|uniref:DUF3168 domain-containing protein n=1 Tax=Sphingomonas baiyangensis TaxID=2572576 RepID=A0A4U1L1Y2_9SPHN|nr:DUF3168 domain-containing protein [Sphingomonas baiyangensis]TKD50220.1 DUF3168 domain-containing protein [Sphingomonas baiyangensis]